MSIKGTKTEQNLLKKGMKLSIIGFSFIILNNYFKHCK
jgi:hypothetical protein